ncbi:MAG: hypothetical protein JSS62_01655 [Verrucomicrobia bacterium]|nr:hypothetical protein [Verrucomicrobiota bacterium]MBS0645640.1 hypothetical protein [Verrucomicrobiota bacterium]
MFSLKEYAPDLGLLAEAGLIAIKQGDEESAKKLFNAVGLLDSESPTKKMGYGLIALHKLDIQDAQKHFSEILKVEPKNMRAMAFIAFTHMLSVMGTTKTPLTDEKKIEHLKLASEFSNQVLNSNASDPSTKQLAQSILDWQQELLQLDAQR